MWTVAGGVYASKPRPALVIQDDAFDATDAVTVLPLTTTLIDAPLLRIREYACALSGLERDSEVMVDKMTTVRRANATTRIGRLTAEELTDVERAVMAFLGLAR